MKIPFPKGAFEQLGAALFPSPKGRGLKVRDLIQRASPFARDSRFCLWA
jgi:hypothetical protein